MPSGTTSHQLSPRGVRRLSNRFANYARRDALGSPRPYHEAARGMCFYCGVGLVKPVRRFYTSRVVERKPNGAGYTIGISDSHCVLCLVKVIAPAIARQMILEIS